MDDKIINKHFEKSVGFTLVILTFLTLALSTANTSFSQENKIRLNHFSIDQGLSQSSANCMVQDSLGFIWIGTQDGLNRFDGYSFSIYRPIPDDVNSISDNDILCLLVDKTGSLWIGTENGGLDRFNNSTGTFTSFEYNKNKTGSISSNCVMSMSEDKEGNLWLGTYNGLNYFDKSTSKFYHFHHTQNSQSLSSDTVYSTYIDSKDNLWIGTNRGVDIYNLKSKKIIHYYHNNDKNSIVCDSIYSFTSDSKGNVWIGTPKGLDKFDYFSKNIVHYKYLISNPNSISSNYINVLYTDNDGIIWIGTDDGGLNSFNPKTGLFTRLENKILESENAIDKQIVSIMKDKEGMIWIGTFGSGVYTYNNKKGQFEIIKVSFKNLNKLQENDVSTICKDDQNNLWIGTNYLGLNKFDKKKQRFIHYEHTSSAKSISNNSINIIFKDKCGIIWVGTISGLDKYNPLKNSFSHFKNEPNNSNSLGNNNVNAIAEDQTGNLWLGFTGGGIDKFDPVNNKFIHFVHNPKNTNSLSSSDILNLFFDNKGILCIGTDGSGLDRFDTKTGKFVHYIHNSADINSLSHSVVFDVYQFPGDTSGNLWIGTGGGGLDLLNTKTGKIKSYTESNGLANNEIYGILGDQKGNLWMSTNHGISEYNTHKGTFRNYDVSDNLQSNEFNQGAFFEGSKGKMYFGGINGLNSFLPDLIKNNSFNPEIVFTSFRVLNNPDIYSKSIWTTKIIKLSYYDNIISLKFAALSFIDPPRNHFKYVLKGLSDNWIDNGTSNVVTFSSLSPGRYVLYVQGTNNDGTWSRNIASIKIIIEPPFWQTWWFRGIVVFIIVYFIYFIFKLRLRSIEQHEKKLEIMVGEKTIELKSKKEELEVLNEKQKELLVLLTNSEKELKELNLNKDKILSVLAHDLRSPFHGLLGLTDILANNIDELTNEETKNAAFHINNTVDNILKLLNNLLEWSLVQSGRIKFIPAVEDLHGSVELIIKLFHVNAEQKSITLKNEIVEGTLVWADKDMVDIILRNLISNAVKFTDRNGQVKISSKNFDEFVEIKVSDTGVGIDEQKQNKLFNLNAQLTTKGTQNESGTGLGLNLCKELISKHGGSIRVESKIGEGTSFIFTLQKPSNNQENKIAKEEI